MQVVQNNKAKLVVRIIEARGLKIGDVSGSSDPFVELRIKDQSHYHKTRIVKQTINPFWNEQFDLFPPNPETDVLLIKVYDFDLITTNDLLGEIEIPVSYYMSKPGGVEEWRHLQRKHNYGRVDTQGDIKIFVQYQGPFGQVPFPVQYGNPSAPPVQTFAPQINSQSTYPQQQYPPQTYPPQQQYPPQQYPQTPSYPPNQQYPPPQQQQQYPPQQQQQYSPQFPNSPLNQPYPPTPYPQQQQQAPQSYPQPQSYPPPQQYPQPQPQYPVSQPYPQQQQQYPQPQQYVVQGYPQVRPQVQTFSAPVTYPLYTPSTPVSFVTVPQTYTRVVYTYPSAYSRGVQFVVPIGMAPHLAAKMMQASAMFRTFDTNYSGYLSKKEWKRAMYSLGYAMNKWDAKRLFYMVDTDRSGRISEREFCEFWLSTHPY